MLEKLHQVQEHDLQIDALEREQGDVPPELTAKEAEVATVAAQLAELQAKHDSLRKTINSHHLELESLQAQRKKATEASYTAANAKEVSQYQNQVLQFEGRIQDLEDDTLPLMEQMEQLEDSVTSTEAQLAALQPELETLQAREKARVQGLEAQVDSLAIEREGLVQGIDKPLLQQYEQIRRSKRGIGLVPVQGQQCGGCRMRLPIYVMQKVGKGRGLTRCPSCGRILYKHQAEA